MRTEASSIWSPYDVRIQWSALPGGVSCAQALGSFEVLVDVKRLRASGTSKPVLGSTWITPSGIDRAAIRIDRDATEQLIRSLAVEELSRRLGRSEIESADVGRALGRVLAHEIGHILLGTSQHQRRGLMRATFFAGDLVDPQPRTYDLSSEEVERLREHEDSLRTCLSKRGAEAIGAPGSSLAVVVNWLGAGEALSALDQCVTCEACHFSSTAQSN